MESLDELMSDHEDRLYLMQELSSIEQMSYEITVLQNAHMAITTHGMSDALSNFVDSEGTLTNLYGVSFRTLTTEVACEGILNTIHEAIKALIQKIADFFKRLFNMNKRSKAASKKHTKEYVALMERLDAALGLHVDSAKEFRAAIFPSEVATAHNVHTLTSVCEKLTNAYGLAIEPMKSGTAEMTTIPLKEIANSYAAFLQLDKNNPFPIIKKVPKQKNLKVGKSGWAFTEAKDFERFDKHTDTILNDIESHKDTLEQVLLKVKKTATDDPDDRSKIILSQVSKLAIELGRINTTVLNIKTMTNTIKTELGAIIKKVLADADKK